jgi:hypothetical protein
VDRVEGGLESHLGSGAADRFRALKESVAKRVSDAEDKVSSVDILREIDWNAAFAEAMEEHETVLRKDSERYLDRLAGKVSDVIEAWYESDERLLERETAAILEESRHRMRALLSAPNAGAKFSPDEVGALLTLDIDLNQRLLDEMETVETPPRDSSATVKIPLERIPVRRGFADLLLLRSGKRLRKSIFGKPDAPAKPVPAAIKEKRLGANGRQFLSDFLKDQMIASLVERPRSAGLDFLKAFVERFQSLLETILEDHREAALAEVEAARRAQRQHENVERTCSRLRSEFESLRKKLDGVRQEFGQPAENVES